MNILIHSLSTVFNTFALTKDFKIYNISNISNNNKIMFTSETKGRLLAVGDYRFDRDGEVKIYYYAKMLINGTLFRLKISEGLYNELETVDDASGIAKITISAYNEKASLSLERFDLDD